MMKIAKFLAIFVGTMTVATVYAISQQLQPIMPNPILTPGKAATFDISIICTNNNTKTYSKTHRKTSNNLKNWVMKEYGLTSREDIEIDHLWPLCAGGADEAENLWPQSYSGPWNAHDKDKLEDRVCLDICQKNLDPRIAFQKMTTDWHEFYIEMFGSIPANAK